jgi:hypothetical protein
MSLETIDSAPGFRRRFRITPKPGCVLSEVEDDYHCMGLTIHHDGLVATQINADLRRAPWTTCPGAPAQVEQTFTGVALSDFARRGDKKGNCTHLYDLALLAAAHALDLEVLVYDILVSDPFEGRRVAELRSNGKTVLGWTEQAGKITEPAELAGLTVWTLNPWIDSLTSEMQEAARALRWGAVLAHGRQIPIEKQSDASRMPPNCYTFQPARAAVAQRIVDIRDFSDGSAQPLEAGA